MTRTQLAIYLLLLVQAESVNLLFVVPPTHVYLLGVYYLTIGKHVLNRDVMKPAARLMDHSSAFFPPIFGSRLLVSSRESR